MAPRVRSPKPALASDSARGPGGPSRPESSPPLVLVDADREVVARARSRTKQRSPEVFRGALRLAVRLRLPHGRRRRRRPEGSRPGGAFQHLAAPRAVEAAHRRNSPGVPVRRRAERGPAILQSLNV